MTNAVEILFFRRIAGMSTVLVVLAGVLEKIGEVNIVYAVVVLFKSYGAQKRVVCFVRQVFRVVNTAKVYKIQRGAPHNEQRFKIIFSLNECYIVDFSAVWSELKLAHARKSLVDRSKIRKRVLSVFDIAFCRRKLLLFF